MSFQRQMGLRELPGTGSGPALQTDSSSRTHGMQAPHPETHPAHSLPHKAELHPGREIPTAPLFMVMALSHITADHPQVPPTLCGFVAQAPVERRSAHNTPPSLPDKHPHLPTAPPPPGALLSVLERPDHTHFPRLALPHTHLPPCLGFPEDKLLKAEAILDSPTQP